MRMRLPSVTVPLTLASEIVPPAHAVLTAARSSPAAPVSVFVVTAGLVAHCTDVTLNTTVFTVSEAVTVNVPGVLFSVSCGEVAYFCESTLTLATAPLTVGVGKPLMGVHVPPAPLFAFTVKVTVPVPEAPFVCTINGCARVLVVTPVWLSPDMA